jgi:hypothetical protein
LANIEPVAAFDGNRQFSSIYERRTVDWWNISSSR